MLSKTLSEMLGLLVKLQNPSFHGDLYPLLKILFKGHFSLQAPAAFPKYLQQSLRSYRWFCEVEWMDGSNTSLS